MLRCSKAIGSSGPTAPRRGRMFQRASMDMCMWTSIDTHWALVSAAPLESSYRRQSNWDLSRHDYYPCLTSPLCPYTNTDALPAHYFHTCPYACLCILLKTGSSAPSGPVHLCYGTLAWWHHLSPIGLCGSGCSIDFWLTRCRRQVWLPPFARRCTEQ